jgi:hypothetical protein
MSKESYHNTKAIQLQKSISKTATFTTGYVDMQDVGALTILYNIGVIGSNVGVSTAILECDTYNGSYTAAGASDIIGVQPTGLTSSVPVGGGSNLYPVGYIGNKRYIEAQVTLVNGGNGVLIGVEALKSKYSHNPVQS